MESQKDLEGRLFIASERFELVAKATHDVIWDWDLENSTVWWNEGMEIIYGHDLETLPPGADSWYDNIHPDDQERVLHKIHQVIDKGESNWSDDYRFKRGDGSYAYVRDRGYTIHKDGKPVRMLGSMQDITDQVLLQKAREESEERLSFALRSAQLGTWDLDPVNKKLEWDERCGALFGFSREETIVYEDIFKHIHPEDQNRVDRAVKRALDPSGDGSYDCQFRARDPEGETVRWVHCKGQAHFINGEAFRFSGIVQDVTERVTYQEKAYFADQQATMTIEGTGAGSFLLDVSSNEIVYSPTLAVILTGENAGIMPRNALLSHLHPEDELIRKKAFEKAAESGELNYEARYIWNDGSHHWAKVIARYLYDNSEKGMSLSGIVFDITDRVESERRLKASEEHFRSMIEQAPVATALFVGKDMIIETPNEAMLKFWGKGNSVIGMPLREALPELAGQSYLEILNEVFESGTTYHAEGSRADLVIDGVLQVLYFDFTYKPLLNSNGQVYAIMDMAVDATARVIASREIQESEERYRQLADELEIRVQQRTDELKLMNQELINSNNNLQQFAYAASHDMQEPLRKIQSFSSRLQSLYADVLDANGLFMLTRMQDAAKRMSLLIDDLLTYSRLSVKEGESEAVDLNRILEEVISDLEITVQEQQAVVDYDTLPVIPGNARQFVQLMQNLISNAIKYRVPDRDPEIRISSRLADPSEIGRIPNIDKDRPYVRIDISDNGIGFEEKYLDRIFQMFQRLHGKAEYSGSGIGLALCKKVVQNHHGYITATSRPSEGSVFMIYLPSQKDTK